MGAGDACRDAREGQHESNESTNCGASVSKRLSAIFASW